MSKKETISCLFRVKKKLTEGEKNTESWKGHAEIFIYLVATTEILTRGYEIVKSWSRDTKVCP